MVFTCNGFSFLSAQVEKLKEENERLQRLLQERSGTDKTFKDVGVQFTYLLPMIGKHACVRRDFVVQCGAVLLF